MTEAAALWLRDGLTVLFGALAGGVTNRVAIVMLFHPYEPPRLLGRPIRWLQGAVPKNRERLAGTIGRTVGTRLLTTEDVAAELQDARLREAFEDQLRGLIGDLFRGGTPSARELLPATALEELHDALAEILDGIFERAIASLDSEAFADDATRLLDTVAESLRDESLAESLGEERIAELRGRADEWMAQVIASDSFADTVYGHLERAAGRLLRPGRSFEELLPAGLVAAFEHAVRDYLPLVMERLGRLLEDPKARARVEGALRDLLDRFMQDLRFHQRVVAKLIITEETVDRVVDTLEAEGADRVGALLREGEVQDAMARSVNQAILEFLRRPVVDVLGRPDDPQVCEALRSVTAWIVEAADDPEVRAFLLDRAESAVLLAGRRSWGDAVRLAPARRVGGWLAGGLRSEPGRDLYLRLRGWTVDRLLSRPIGALAARGRADAADRLAAALSDPVWNWVSSKVPEIASQVRVAERVEEKIATFPLTELERLIRSVTQRELNLIVRLGYVLGAGIGASLVVVRHLLG
ncbi:MAG: DUF445 family protein [Gemmatimonadota bacterium]|nr:DUF445 family protein [Gemmatimonadota bacterium]